MIDESLTKRQHEILERLEQDMPVKKIATDLGVSRNAVYLQIERLREPGRPAARLHASGQPPRAAPPAPMPGLELGAAVPAPGFGGGPLHGVRSELARASPARGRARRRRRIRPGDRGRRRPGRRRRARLRARQA